MAIDIIDRHRSIGEADSLHFDEDMEAKPKTNLRQKLEYWAVRSLVGLVGLPPRSVARSLGAGIGSFAFHALARLRRTGERNLQIAYPDSTPEWRHETLRGTYRTLGWQLAEFCQMRRYTRASASRFIEYEGFSHWKDAAARGRGVLIVTGHLGAWELSSFYHSLMGHPMSMVIRRLDNPLVDEFVNAIRCGHGNRILHKDDFARGIISTVRTGGSIGILMDTNMTPPQGVFVPFFGTPACTPSGLARIAAKTGAAVVPGCLMWHAEKRKYVLHFYPEIAIAATGDAEADAVENTARCTAAIERVIREFPEQWLWLHRRWKTRPAREPSLY